MKKIPLLISFVYLTIQSAAQNVGIGTTNPQNTLHVAGGVRIDALGAGSGIVTKNSSGDLSAVPYTGNPADVLKGNGSFGPVTGLTPSSGVITSKIYNNTALINAGFTLVGEIPQVLTYSTISEVFSAYTTRPTYTRGVTTKLSAPMLSNFGDPTLAVWTGSIMYVVTLLQGTYAYNPDTDDWALLSSSFIGGNYGDKIVWTGTEIILWKGESSTGQKYNPFTNTITNISTTNAPVTRNYHTMTWDGTRVIVWGGSTGVTVINTGAMYNPVTDTWTAMSIAGAPAARRLHTAVWCNNVNRLIVWGGSTIALNSEMNTGAIFDPASNTWTGATNTTGAPGIRANHTAIWTGTEMIVFGGDFNANTNLNTGGKYNPSTNTWTATSTTGAPAVRFHAAVWTGTEIYISGGLTGGNPSAYMYKYDPSLNTWAYAAFFNEGKFWHHCFYKSNMLVVWGGKETSGSGNYSNTGFRYFLENTASSSTAITAETLYLYQKN